MTVLNPPVSLENPDNQYRVEYIQNETTSPEFDYPAVSDFFLIHYMSTGSVSINKSLDR